MSVLPDRPENILMRMHGMLEIDQIETPQEFVLMISTLHAQGEISIQRISKHLDTSEERIQEWVAGNNIPEVVFMPVLVKKVMRLIEEVLNL